jgi:predicted transcriptional regulator
LSLRAADLYDGWPVALAGADEVHLHPALLELAELEEGHAMVRFACALALHAFEVATGLQRGPFDQPRAERFARALLMPCEQFLALVDESDAALAEWFGVPVEQVPLRRAELSSPAHGPGSLPD